LGVLKSVRTVLSNDEFSLPGVELKILQSLLLPFISVAWGKQLRFGELGSHPQWEYCVEVFQRQHSLHQWRPQRNTCH
jgi:hypothetical protein